MYMWFIRKQIIFCYGLGRQQQYVLAIYSQPRQQHMVYIKLYCKQLCTIGLSVVESSQVFIIYLKILFI